MKRLLWLAAFACCFSTFAKEEQQPPLDPAFMGVQKFAFVANNTNVYAYYMSSYDKPNNYQILYKVSQIPTALRIMVRDAQGDGNVVTVITKPFNLQNLIRGNNVTVDAEVFLGHFDRGGMSVYPQVPITLSEQMYVRELVDLAPSSNRHKYDTVRIDNETKILVKQVTMAPSYANLILFDDSRSCVTEFYASSAMPSVNEIYMKLIYCGSMKPMFFDNSDFAS